MLTTCIIWPHGGISMPSFFILKNTKLFCHPVHLFFLSFGPHILNPTLPIFPSVKKIKLYKYRQPCPPVTDTLWRPLTQETSRLHMPPPTHPPPHIRKEPNAQFSPFLHPLKIHTVDILPLLYYTHIIYNSFSWNAHLPETSLKLQSGSVDWHQKCFPRKGFSSAKMDHNNLSHLCWRGKPHIETMKTWI